MQIVASSDPQQLRMWEKKSAEGGGDNGEGGGTFTFSRFVTKCGSWWRPRQPQLGSTADSAEFEVELKVSCTARPGAG